MTNIYIKNTSSVTNIHIFDPSKATNVFITDSSNVTKVYYKGPSRVTSTPAASASEPIPYKRASQGSVSSCIRVAEAAHPPFDTHEGLEVTLTTSEWENLLTTKIMVPREVSFVPLLEAIKLRPLTMLNIVCIVKSIKAQSLEETADYRKLQITDMARTKETSLIVYPSYGQDHISDELPIFKAGDCLVLLNAAPAGCGFVCWSKELFRCKVDCPSGPYKNVCVRGSSYGLGLLVDCPL